MLAAATLAAGTAGAGIRIIRKAISDDLDHVFLIMMENQTNTDILSNPNAPFINQYAAQSESGDPVFRRRTSQRAKLSGDRRRLQFRPDRTIIGRSGSMASAASDNAPSSGCGHAFTPISVEGLDNPVVATATTSTDCNGQISLGGNPAGRQQLRAAQLSGGAVHPAIDCRPVGGEGQVLEELSGKPAGHRSRRLRRQLLGRRVFQSESGIGVLCEWRPAHAGDQYSEAVCGQTQPVRLFRKRRERR